MSKGKSNSSKKNTKKPRKPRNKKYNDNKYHKDDGNIKKRFAYFLKQALSDIPEGRRDDKGSFRYKMCDFMIGVIIAMLRGCYLGDAIVQFWKENTIFLHEFGIFTTGNEKGCVPSLATFYRLATILDADKFCELFFCFLTKFVVRKTSEGLQIISVDGKAMRGTSCGTTGRPIHILTAFYNVLSIPIRCVDCAEKSNEISAWQKLLDSLGDFCKGKIFTSDAMGCQKDIVKKIVFYGGKYCLALKGNHPKLEKEAYDMISRNINFKEQYIGDDEMGHGRIEKRTCTVYIADPSDKNSYITDLDQWTGIKRIIRIQVKRIDKKSGKETISDDRIYISNFNETAENFNKIIRDHWLVEIFHYEKKNVMRSHSNFFEFGIDNKQLAILLIRSTSHNKIDKTSLNKSKFISLDSFLYTFWHIF